MNKSKNIILILILILLFFILCGVLSIIYISQNPYRIFDPLAIIFQKDSGYDFDKLKKDYPDIIGLIEVDGTNIKEPVVKEPNNDLYYMNHDASKEYDVAGAAFIQKCNNSNFSDPVTLIYGHNMIDDRIFSNLLWFKNPDFFNENQYFNIYIPGHKLRYNIIAAYDYDNRHIMNSFNFSDTNILTKYQNDVLHSNTFTKNIRESAIINQSDKIIQLSTCLDDLSITNQRYIVTGLLIEKIRTN